MLSSTEQEKYSAVKNEVLQILAVKYILPNNLKTQLKNISVEQQRDEKLNELVRRLKDRDNPKFQNVNNILYKLIDGQWKIMIKDHTIEDMTWACHESVAHASAYKYYLTLREDVIWMKMSRKIKSILHTSHTCQTSKYPNQHTYVKMGNIVTHNKNKLLSIDFLGLPHASRGMRNLVVRCV